MKHALHPDPAPSGAKKIVDIPICPFKSEEQNQLRYAALAAGFNEELLFRLLWLIRAHETLLHFPFVAHHLSEILAPYRSEIENQESQARALEPFRGWPKLLDWLNNTQYRGSIENASRGLVPTISRQGKGIQQHSLYEALLAWPPDKFAEQYRELQFQVLLAHANYLYLAHGKAISSLETSATERNLILQIRFPILPYSAMHPLKKLADQEWESFLPNIPLHLGTTRFLEEIEKDEWNDGISQFDLDSWKEKLQAIRRFIARCIGIRSWEYTPRTRYSNRLPFQEEEDDADDKDDKDTQHLAARWVLTTNISSDSKIKDLVSSDLDQEEMGDSRLWLLVDPGQGNIREEIIDATFAARGRMRHAQMANQFLPWQYTNLTLDELAYLLQRASARIASLKKQMDWSEKDLVEFEIILLLHTMLWTGRSLESALELHLVRTKSLGWKGIRSGEIHLPAFDLDEAQWIVPAYIPPYRSEIKDGKRHANELSKYLALPDRTQFSVLLRIYIQRRVISIGEKEVVLFNTEHRRVVKEFGIWLKEADKSDRLTPARITNYLFPRLHSVAGDRMAAVLITGRKTVLSRTQQYYATYSASKLQHIYVRTVDEVTDMLQVRAKKKAIARKEYVQQEGYVGARLCAKMASVQLAVRKQIENLASLRAQKEGTESIEFHNAYTLYTVLMFAYATSIRAIRCPYVRLEEVDEHTDFILIADKDNDSEGKTRLCWVPKLVQRQMRHLEQHIRKMRTILNIDTDWKEPCFFLSSAARPLEVRPKTVSENMNPYLALPPNAHRRFMRHELLNRGCAPEAVNQWMGHAFFGEESWGHFSMYSLADYKADIGPHLEALLAEIGWQEIDGN